MDKAAVLDFLLHHWIMVYFLRPLLLLYLLLFLFALFVADIILFAGSHVRASYQDTADIIKLTTSDGVKISAEYLPNPAATYTVLYSHGNGEDLGKQSDKFEKIQDAGFAIFAYDYHGYGTSQGEPSEANAYRDIDAAYAYLTETLHVLPEHIIIYGRSLGSGPSVDLTTRKPVAGLILESAFTTAFRTRTVITLLPFDRFRNIDKIGKIHCPVLVIHGRSDHTNPFNHGMQLYRAANEPKRFLWVDDAGHNDLEEVAGDSYMRALRDFLKLVDTTHPQQQ